MNKPKRILIIGLTERMGGVETFIYNTTIFSDKSKYKYDYLVHGSDHCVFQKEIEKFYDDGEQHFFFVRKYKENPIGCIADLKRFYADNGHKYDYIHFQSGSTAEILYAYPFCKKYGIKVISHSHNGNGYSPCINKIFRTVVNQVTYKRLACSRVAAEWLFGMKEADHTQIVINGIDTKRFTFNPINRSMVRNEYGIGKELVIGHVGRFSEQKNHPFILKIFKAILKINPEAKLMLVGTGEDENRIKDLGQEMGINNSIIYTGKQPRTEDYYSAFDVFLMPSLYEGLPIVGVEAQCEGLPCYFSDQIDKQIMITDNARMLPLNLSAEVWAKRILEQGRVNVRLSAPSVISQKGYSITGTVQELEKVYGF
ncbi:glycosyltransferase [Oribacterium sp. HCP28S3_H8]|uniref:glycosyltransferase n=1 Tax=Oribacterium sp. HCP28S3_H8 TaxID=3438945 RepID=UPI003F88FCF6